jgi:hypothetical protein
LLPDDNRTERRREAVHHHRRDFSFATCSPATAPFLLEVEVTLNGAIVPVWLSGLAFVVAGGLAVMVWRENRR